MILDYKHSHSGHCETGATSNLLRYKGLNISEPMAFGIGGGLYFSYLPFIKVQNAPLIAFRILPNKIFRQATKRLGVRGIVIKKFKDPAESMKALDRNIEKGIPTGLQVGVFHLPYFPPDYRAHYNFHNIVIFGKENGSYYVSEPVREQVQKLTYEELIKVRFAKGAFPPNGKMYYIESVPSQPDIKKAIKSGINDTISRMIKDPFPLVGIRGIRFLSRAMKNWPGKLPPQQANYYLAQLVRSIEEVGTGGTGFRFIFGAFLMEAGELLKNEGLIKISHEMGKNANHWREFAYRGARFVKHRAEENENYSTLSEILLECADREEKIFRDLSGITY